MDQAKLHEYARYHMMAFLSGDRQGAMSDLTEEALEQAGPVVDAIPKKVEESELLEIVPSGDQYLVTYNYAGGDTDIVVETVWEEREGRPMIVGIRLAS